MKSIITFFNDEVEDEVYTKHPVLQLCMSIDSVVVDAWLLDLPQLELLHRHLQLGLAHVRLALVVLQPRDHRERQLGLELELLHEVYHHVLVHVEALAQITPVADQREHLVRLANHLHRLLVQVFARSWSRSTCTAATEIGVRSLGARSHAVLFGHGVFIATRARVPSLHRAPVHRALGLVLRVHGRKRGARDLRSHPLLGEFAYQKNIK